MAQTFRQGSWRGAIGLIAAYALVLQALAAAVVVTRAAAWGAPPDAASLSAICAAHDDGVPVDGGAPATSGVHCPACMLPAFAAATLPDAAAATPTPPVSQSSPALRQLVIASARTMRPASRGPPQAA